MTRNDDLGPLPKVDPRDDEIERARRKAFAFFLGLKHCHKLTPTETLHVLSRVNTSLLSTCLDTERRDRRNRNVLPRS